MLTAVLIRCAALSVRGVFAFGTISAAITELATVVLRFGLNLQSTRDTASTVGLLTFGLRIHHGYIGVFLLLLGWCFPRGHRNALWIVAIALILSDLAHHFLVLWPIEGSPQFDLVYPDHPFWNNATK